MITRWQHYLMIVGCLYFGHQMAAVSGGCFPFDHQVAALAWNVAFSLQNHLLYNIQIMGNVVYKERQIVYLKYANNNNKIVASVNF